MFMTIENEGYDMYLSPRHNFKMANVFETCRDSDNKKVGKLHRFDPSQQYPNGKWTHKLISMHRAMRIHCGLVPTSSKVNDQQSGGCLRVALLIKPESS